MDRVARRAPQAARLAQARQEEGAHVRHAGVPLAPPSPPVGVHASVHGRACVCACVCVFVRVFVRQVTHQRLQDAL